MIKDDYIMRLNHEVIRTLLKLIFNIDEEKSDDSFYGDDIYYQKYTNLVHLASQGKINDAENALYDQLDLTSIHDLQGALMFYEYLNNIDDEQLESNGFSYEEILAGVKEVVKLYGYEGLAEAFKI